MSPATWIWIRITGFVVLLLLLAAAWQWTDLREWADPERIGAMVEPYRRSWLGLPLVLVGFVLLQLVLFPVLVLIFVCGMVFGPWLGTLYALLGSLAGAVIPFFVGRRLGREKVERWAGGPVRYMTRVLERRGVVAVFLVRKIPAPYSLVNLVCGASPVSFRDFLLGTLLGMFAGVVVITVLGGQLMEVLADPEPGQIGAALGLVGGVVLLALLAQYLVNRRLAGRAEG